VGRGELQLHSQPVLRLLFACVAIAAAAALAGCDSNTTPNINGRHMQPLSERVLADIEKRNMTKDAPILVRIFKEESELELWKQDNTGRFALLRTYPICRWSGELGPKIQQGDRQAPEGFYTITPGQMNPSSHYYLAFDTGYPNTYDQANGRTGAELMIHGDCASAGCYAMTDEQIAEIYALAREAFFGGQKSFQVQAYPFRMTPINMARHRNSPHMAFWQMLKQGYDHFEVTRLEPRIDVCDRQYVFNAQSSSKFSPTDRCPAYTVPQKIASAVRNKERRDDSQFAQLVARGVPTAATTTGKQGGMNAIFLAAVRANGGPGSDIHTASGTIPGHVHPPVEQSPGLFSTAGLLSFAAPSPTASQVQVASAVTQAGGGGLGNASGSRRETQNPQPRGTAAQLPQATSKQTATTAKPARTAGSSSTSSTADVKRAESKKVDMVKPQPSSRPLKAASAQAEAEREPASTGGIVKGAAPTLPASSFDNRFSGLSH
jgi:murein L,D-transpeptidase YafK